MPTAQCTPPRPAARLPRMVHHLRSALVGFLVVFAMSIGGVTAAFALCQTQSVANPLTVNFNASTQIVTVSARVTRTGVIPPPPPTPNSCPAGQNVNVGNVTFTSPAFTGPVSGNLPTGGVTGVHSAVATIAAGMAAGTYPLVAHYNGSTNNEPSGGALEIASTITIQPAASTTVLSSATSNPSAFGSAVALTATLASPAGTPAGSVSFFNGATLLGTAIASGGVASLSVSSLPVGTHAAITAVYAGDGNFTGSTSPLISRTVTVAPQAIIFANPGPQTFAPAGTLALTASATSGLTVTFASTTPAVCTVSGATITTVSAGSCSIIASQPGDTNYAPAPDVAQTFSILPLGTTITLVSSPNPSQAGQAVTLTATIAPTTATGLVTFRADGASIGTATPAAGTAQIVTTALAAGTRSLTAEIAASPGHTAATSTAITHTVLQPGSVRLRIVTGSGNGTFQFTSATLGLAATVTTSAGAGEVGPVALAAGTHAVSLTVPGGFSLSRVSCSDADSTAQVAPPGATIQLAAGEDVTCTFEARGSLERTVEAISRFLARRNDLILSHAPDADRQIDRLAEFNARNDTAGPPDATAGLVAGGRLASGFGGSPAAGARGSAIGLADLAPDDERPGARTPDVLQSDSARQFAVSGSLASVRRATAGSGGTDGLSLTTGARPAIVHVPSRFDVWVEARYGSFEDGGRRNGSTGHFGIVHLGADYVVSPSLLVGTYVQIDSMSERLHATVSLTEGTGFMAGPYATLRLTDEIYLQGRAAWGRSNNTVSPFLTYTDDFDTERWLVSATLKGRWTYGAFAVKPAATVAYIEDVSDAYTDTLGAAIPSLSTSLGQVRFGPEFSYRHIAEDGTLVEPRLGLELIHNFSGGGLVVDGVETGPEGTRGRVEAGLRAVNAGGLTFDISAGLDGIGAADYSAISGRAGVRVPMQ